MTCELMIDAQFFHSDHVPQMSIFSGRTEGITPYKMTFGLPTEWRFSWRGLFEPTTLTVHFPAAPGDINVWQFKQLASLAVGATGVIGLLVLAVAARDLVTSIFGWAGLVLGVIAAITMVAWGQRYSSQEVVRMLLVNREGRLRLILPDRLKAVHAVYQHAYEQWCAAGRPLPLPPDQDDDFADAVKPGWDEQAVPKDAQP